MESVLTLQNLANLAEILGGITILGGAAFAIVQLREIRAQRRQAVAVELVRSFQNSELARAVNLIRELPDHASAETLRARGPEYERAAIMLATTYETIGLLAFRRLGSFSLVRELTGGLALVIWRKLSRWIETVREEHRQPSWAEWFQWLAEQLAREADEKEAQPAYRRFADWRPRG